MTRQNDEILLIGAGAMAIEYAKILKDLGLPLRVLGRGAASAAAFHAATGIAASSGALSDQLAALDSVPERAIVTVNAQNLAEVSAFLIQAGVRRLLVEKPAVLDLNELAQLQKVVAAQSADLRIAYNRRFMASALKASALIAEDGGVLSVKCDFTEASRRIEALNKPRRELETWFYGNSTHVLDLAFHLFGPPSALSATVAGSMPWHPAAAVFVGHGQNATGGLISWHANWAAPGRWGVEVMTAHRRLILQPMEKLRVQEQGSFAETEVALDETEDLRYKPGLLRQLRAFLYGEDDGRLPDLAEHARKMAFYEVIRTGGDYRA
jgi:predicted dehydrogenase